MLDIETLNDLKSYLDRTHPSYRERMKPATEAKWGLKKSKGFKPYYISPEGDH